MHRLRNRVFLFILLLLAVVLSAVLALTQQATEAHAYRQAVEQSRREGERFRQRLLEQLQHWQRLAGLLSDQLHSALDPAEALEQARRRTAADLIELSRAPQQRWRAGTEPAAADPVWSMAADGVELHVHGGRLWLLATVGEDRSRHAHLRLGRVLDARWLAEMAAAAAVDLSLLQGAPGAWEPLLSSRPGSIPATLQGWTASAGEGGRRLPGAEAQVWHLSALELPGTPLHLLLQQPLQRSVVEPELLRWQLLAIGLLALLLALAGALWIGHSVSRPLAAMVRYMRRVGEGDTHAEAPTERRGEIGALAREFAFMLSAMAQREASIRHLAYNDGLTGLANRNRFQELIDERLQQRKGERFAVLVMDIDRFREINDTLGHVSGDRILKHVGLRLSHVRRECDQLARLSGDEFAVLLGHIELGDLLDLAQRYRAPFNDPIATDGIALDVSAAMGLAVYPDHGDTAGLLLQKAEVALYLAKSRHQLALVYSPEIDRHSVLRLTLMAELRLAIERNQLELYVQPKLDVRAWRIVGVECLVRWVHPTHGFVPPDEFIPLAEQTGNVRQLTGWMIGQALKHCAGWRELGYTLKVAVNVSTVDLLDAQLPARVASQLSQQRLPASALILEVTESAVMEDPERSIPVLTRLRELGVELSIDDYGTGYSSMAQLKRLPVDELKIDKSFVFDVADNPDDAVIVRSTIELGHNMELRVVAEGVESERVLDWLSRFGCDVAQGYLLSKPLPAAQLLHWLQHSPYLAAGQDEPEPGEGGDLVL